MIIYACQDICFSTALPKRRFDADPKSHITFKDDWSTKRNISIRDALYLQALSYPTVSFILAAISILQVLKASAWAEFRFLLYIVLYRIRLTSSNY